MSLNEMGALFFQCSLRSGLIAEELKLVPASRVPSLTPGAGAPQGACCCFVEEAHLHHDLFFSGQRLGSCPAFQGLKSFSVVLFIAGLPGWEENGPLFT